MTEKRVYRQRLYYTHVGPIPPQFEPSSLEREVRQYRARWGKFLPPDLDAPILDVGCGCGQFLYFLQRMGYRNVHGVDASSPSVETARQIGVRQVELGDALTYLRRYSNYFAVISAQHFLEHFTPEEVLKVLDAVYAALRPRGILIAVVPNAASPFGTYTRYWDPTHELSFSPPSMERLLKAAGFESVRFLEYGPVIHGVKSVLRMTLWQVIRLLLYMYVLAEVGGDRYRVFTRDMRVIAYKA